MPKILLVLGHLLHTIYNIRISDNYHTQGYKPTILYKHACSSIHTHSVLQQKSLSLSAWYISGRFSIDVAQNLEHR